VLLIFLAWISAIAEVFSIGAVLPFLGVLTSPERVFQHRLVRQLSEQLGILSPAELLTPLTILFCVAVTFAGLARFLVNFVNTKFSNALGADISTSMYRRTLYQPYAIHISRNTSEVIAGITGKANSIVGGTVLPILNLVSASITLAMTISAIILIEPVIASVTLVGFGGSYAMLAWAAKRQLVRDGVRISVESSRVIKALQEGLGGIRDVLIDGAQEIYCRLYRDADLPLRKAQANVAIVSVTPRFGIEALGMVLIALLAYTLASRVGGIGDSIPILGALALSAQRSLPMLQLVYQGYSSIIAGKASLQDGLDLLEQQLPNEVGLSSTDPIKFKNIIDVKNLSFRYGAQAPWVLADIDLTIYKGQRIGFIGKTGSGKSTLIDVIMGLLQPSKGSVEVDGVEICDGNLRSWQSKISHVPQNIFLSDSTIAENIAFGLEPNAIDQERVKLAAQSAQLAKTIESWVDKYQTYVGERGIRLSGGQRQRIGIARALYKRADVIVFDEATSALDNETEESVMDAIAELRSSITVLIIAHRLTTLKSCDVIVELSEGRIKRVCDYSQLARTMLGHQKILL
jgi:ABC-type bacteriocin/lantibiotic exporter with double-glycine peptidase domain